MSNLSGALLQGRSSMAFAVMPIGAEFIARIGNDAYTSTCFKISDTDAINLTNQSERVKIPPDAICSITGKVIPVHAEMTDLEKVALALLDRYPAAFTGLSEWIGVLIRNPDERRTLEQYLQNQAIENADGQLADLIDLGVAISSPLDRLVWILAQAVRDYRNAGRPDGELSTTVKTADESSYTSVTQSLSRSVLEFHDQIVRLAMQGRKGSGKVDG